MKKGISAALSAVFAGAVLLAGCSGPETSKQKSDSWKSEESVASTVSESRAAENVGNEEENREMQMNVQVGGGTFTADLEKNEAADALVEMMEQGPVTVRMRDYSGFEKVGSLERSLPADDRQTAVQAGDIVLYQGNQIVMFYGSHSWSYTRMGHIEDLAGWEEALGSGDVTAVFSLKDSETTGGKMK